MKSRLLIRIGSQTPGMVCRPSPPQRDATADGKAGRRWRVEQRTSPYGVQSCTSPRRRRDGRSGSRPSASQAHRRGSSRDPQRHQMAAGDIGSGDGPSPRLVERNGATTPLLFCAGLPAVVARLLRQRMPRRYHRSTMVAGGRTRRTALLAAGGGSQLAEMRGASVEGQRAQIAATQTGALSSFKRSRTRNRSHTTKPSF